MRRLFLSTGIGLSSLTATAQLPPDDWFSSCDAPSATCISPQIDLLNADYPFSHAGIDLLPASPCGPDGTARSNDLVRDDLHRSREVLAFYQAELTPIADDSGEILQRWERASQSHLPVTSAERMRLKYDSPERPGQELALTCEFQGPVDAADLKQRYDWTVTDDVDAVELTGVPHDRVERLFYKRIIVTLDSASWRPQSLQFVSAENDRRRTVALQPWVEEPSTSIQVVAFRPADEAGLVRTADASNLPPRQLPDEAVPPPLPPAPTPCETDRGREPIEAPKPVRTRWGRMQLDIF